MTFKNLENIENILDILKEEIFEKAFKTAEIVNLTKEEYKKYIDSLDAYCEVKGVRENAIEERNIEIEKKMIKENFPTDIIAKITE